MNAKPWLRMCGLSWIGSACLLAAGAVCGVPRATAGPMVYHAAGQGYRIMRSDSEFAIELMEPDSPAAADARFRMLELGSVGPLGWGPERGRFAILRVRHADEATRARALAEGRVESVRPVYRFRHGGLPHLGTGRVVVKLGAHVGESEAEAMFAEHGARRIEPVGRLPRTWLVEARAAGVDDVRLAGEMHRDSRTEYAHADLISPMLKTQLGGGDTIGDFVVDPFALDQWHLRNTGQEGGVIGADINIEEAFDVEGDLRNGVFGAGVVVGMLDDACDVMHEDLLSNFINVSHDAGTGAESQLAANPQAETERHGTAMMGLICAGLNSKGVVGVAPSARFTASRGADDGLSSSKIAGAFQFALDRNVDVHCNSWAGEPGAPSPGTVRAAVEQAFTDGRDGLGMVVVFPTGNEAVEVAADESLAGLTDDQDRKLVIGVGACNARERVASYSSFGVGVVDVLAPSGDVFLPQIVTTDNTDAAGFDSPGYNNDGFDDFDLANLSDPNYTQGDSFSEVSDPDFFGTSAACAQAAGVAALVMSATGTDIELTATQVRAILQHTANQIPVSDLTEGDYNGITGRSLKYGYGRIDAGGAVNAARQVTPNNPFTWPEPVKNVQIETTATGKILSWEKNDDVRTVVDATGETVIRGDETTTVLVVQRIGLDFEWTPTDGQNHSDGETVDAEQVVTVAQVGDFTSYEFDDSLGIIYFGVFARNAAGRYAFGVSIDSEGNVVEVGRSANTGVVDANANNNSSGPVGPTVPTVQIDVTPLIGVSPLKVTLRGNSPVSDSKIADMSWDFGDGTAPVAQLLEGLSEPIEHTYINAGSTTQTFRPTLTVTDADGDVGRQSVTVKVLPEEGAAEDPTTCALRIIISSPGETRDLGDSGVQGERLELRVDTSRVVGTPENIQWSLGDGTVASSFVVSHTYEIAGTFPVQATVTARTTSGELVPCFDSRLFTVLEDGAPEAEPAPNVSPGNGSSGSSGSSSGSLCGVGMIFPMFTVLGLVLLRRFRLH